MRHRSKPRFLGGKIPSITKVKKKDISSRTTSTFTIKQKLHSKSTYFYRWGSRKKLSSSLTYIIPSVCSLALLVGGIVMINPMQHNSASAIPIGTDGGSTGDANTAPSIAISFPTEGLPEGFDNSENQVTQARAGEVAYRSNIFDVAVKNSDWYAIIVRAANGYTGELKNGNALITGVGNNVAPESFRENTWGYALTKDISSEDSVLTYNSVQENNDLTSAYHANISGENLTERFKLTFAAKMGNDSPSGHYTTKIYLSAVTNPSQVVVLPEFGISTMQEMTNEICKEAKVGTTDRLVDIRDGKAYWVAKLNDKNCWMTQNLDYDVSGASSTLPGSWGKDNTIVRYYDPGYYVYGTPNQINKCKNGSSVSALSECTSYGWVNVLGWMPFDYSYNDSAINEVDELYDSHYLVGNYYSWSAATHSSGDSLTTDGSNASDSICPMGWKLPKGLDTKENGSFYLLLDNYGLTSVVENSANNNDIRLAPTYFLAGGYISWENTGGSALRDIGARGYYWTSTIRSGSTAYYLAFQGDYNKMIPSYYQFEKYQGIPIRCVNDPSITE